MKEIESKVDKGDGGRKSVIFWFLLHIQYFSAACSVVSISFWSLDYSFI